MEKTELSCASLKLNGMARRCILQAFIHRPTTGQDMCCGRCPRGKCATTSVACMPTANASQVTKCGRGVIGKRNTAASKTPNRCPLYEYPQWMTTTNL